MWCAIAALHYVSFIQFTIDILINIGSLHVYSAMRRYEYAKYLDPVDNSWHDTALANLRDFFTTYRLTLLLSIKVRFTVTCSHGIYRTPHDQIFNRESESDLPIKQIVKKKKN